MGHWSGASYLSTAGYIEASILTEISLHMVMQISHLLGNVYTTKLEAANALVASMSRSLVCPSSPFMPKKGLNKR